MKKKYKLLNWHKYNQALINRGNITLWFDESTVDNWESKNPAHSQRGRPFFYSDKCIEVCLSLRSLFRFPLRATQGFLEGFSKCLGLAEKLKIPHYSVLSRRAKDLKINLSYKAKKEGMTDIAIDSTGLKIYGEGEWKTRVHGKGKRRTWRKLHIAIDLKSGQIMRMELTKASVGDDPMLPPLLEGLKEIGGVYADGAYISKASFNAIVKAGGRAKIPLRSGTSISPPKGDKGIAERNRLVREIEVSGSRSSWKKDTDYHRRSLVETTMYRFKTIFGGGLSSRKFDNQVTEAQVKGSLLNWMTQLGMPNSHCVG